MPLYKMSRWWWSLLLVLTLRAECRAKSTVNVPLEHPSYAFVERFEARGVLGGKVGGIRPFSRAYMARLFAVVRTSVQGGTPISPIELKRLKQYEDEFAAELGEQTVSGLAQRTRLAMPLFRYVAKEGDLFADLLFRQRTDRFTGNGRQEPEEIFRHTMGGIVRGHIGERIGFRMSFAQTREQGSRQYNWREQVFERRLEIPQLKGNLTDYHEAMAYMTVSLPYVDVEFGKDEAAWGPGSDDNLGLSNNAPSYTMLRIKSQLGALKLVSITGVLRPCPDRPDSPLCRGLADSSTSYIVNRQSRTLERQKYLAAHRLEVALAPWVDLGFHEIVVYGDRALEPTYLNPFMFYWAAQSHLGDKDNVMMGLDLDFHPGHNQRYYISYVIDDLKKLAIFSDDFANKFSLQTGAFWVDPPGLADGDLRFEYVRIEPWIYTHKFPINTFRHFDSPLGHELAPNSDRVAVTIAKRFGLGLSLTGKFQRSRHGANELLEDGSIRNVGGDLHYGWRPGDERNSKRFLDGLVERRTLLAGGVEWRILPQLVAELGYEHEWGDHVPLPPNWGQGVSLTRRSGSGDGVQRHMWFDLRFHYF
jgi:hypothetical protein